MVDIHSTSYHQQQNENNGQMSKEEESFKKEVAEDVEEGELPEEGEIMDDDEEQQQQTKQQNKTSADAAGEQSRSSPIPRGRSGGRDFPPHRGSSWRRSFGSGGGHFHHNTPFGGKQHFGQRGSRYRDIDDKSATKSEEVMLDSWVRGAQRKSGGGIRGGPISPLRTGAISPIAEQTLAAAAPVEVPDDGKGIKSAKHECADTPTSLVPIKSSSGKELLANQSEDAPPIGQQVPHDDDKDYRMATPPHAEEPKAEPVESSEDDNDFRRSAVPPAHFERQHSPPTHHHTSPRYSSDRRRHRAPSPEFGGMKEEPVGNGNGGGGQGDREHWREGPGGPMAKRNRPFFEEDQHRGEDHHPRFQHDDGGFYDGGGDGGPPPQGDHWHGRGGFRGRGFGGFRGGHGPGRPFYDRIICKFFREGFCRDGEKCTYSHATADSHRQPMLCKFYQQGFCRKNLFCQHLHGEWPCKAFHKGECTKEQCMFSHEPLDDVSRPILERMLEDERLGRTDGQDQQPQFQGGYYQRRRQFEQHRVQQFQQQGPPGQFQQHGGEGPPPQGGPFGQQDAGVQQHQQPPYPHPPGQGPPPQQQQQQPPPAQLPMEFGQPQQHPGALPPPGLVVPPILGQQTPIQQQQQGGSSGTFGFFNPTVTTSSNASPGGLSFVPQGQPTGQQPVGFPPQQQPSSMPPQITPPQQASFQQLQQQAQQGGPCFPHQPSLLGPTHGSPSMGGMPGLQQQPPQLGTPIKMDPFSMMLHQVTPVRPDVPQQQDASVLLNTSESSESSGFNINQMLEQITQSGALDSVPVPSTSKMSTLDDPMDLLASMGATIDGSALGDWLSFEAKPEPGPTNEESPASPPMYGSGAEDADRERAVAKLIPVVCEWRLYPVDIPEKEGPNVQFDMKLVQQISSTNSDPRLRKLAEKQFDLVSKTLVKQEAAAHGETTSQKERDEKPAVKEKDRKRDTQKEEPKKVPVDPRDPRRKSRAAAVEQQPPPTTPASEATTLSSPSVASTTAGPFSFGQTAPSSGPPIGGGQQQQQPTEAELVERQLQMQLAMLGQQQNMGPSPFGPPPPFQHGQQPPPFGMNQPPPTSAFPGLHGPPPMGPPPQHGGFMPPMHPPLGGDAGFYMSTMPPPVVTQPNQQPFQMPPPAQGSNMGPLAPQQQQLGAHAFQVGFGARGGGGGGGSDFASIPIGTTSFSNGPVERRRRESGRREQQKPAKRRSGEQDRNGHRVPPPSLLCIKVSTPQKLLAERGGSAKEESPPKRKKHHSKAPSSPKRRHSKQTRNAPNGKGDTREKRRGSSRGGRRGSDGGGGRRHFQQHWGEGDGGGGGRRHHLNNNDPHHNGDDTGKGGQESPVEAHSQQHSEPDPQQPPPSQPPMSLREKRKHNEYESPLSRIAAASSANNASSSSARY